MTLHAAPPDTEALLEQFELLWRKQAAAPIDSILARADAACRGPLLVELIKIDLEYRWRQAAGGRPLLEEYLARFPELMPLPADLIGEEYRVRQRWGDRPARHDYARRFPERMLQLAKLFERIDADLHAEYAKARGPSRPLANATPWAEPVLSLTTPRQLIDFLAQTGLVPRPQLDQLAAGRPADLPGLARELGRRNWLTPFQIERLLHGRGLELVLGPYLLLDELGAGGTGWVFKARHRHLQRLVSLKVLRRELVADLVGLKRFYQEIQLVSRLSHPHVVRAYDAGPIGSRHVLVLEYLAGTDLGRRVARSGPLPAAQACEYIRQTALGLQYIHDCGLVHRDVAPSNLLVTDAGPVKILDLGLARLRQGAGLTPGQRGSSAWLGGTGAVVVGGTPDYLAPEQALDFHRVDIRADLYSLGCTFYFLLTGRPPFPGGNLTQKLLRHQEELPDLASLKLPTGLPALLNLLLAKAPAERPDTPAEVAETLARMLGQPVSLPVATPPRGEELPTIAGEPFAFVWDEPRPPRRRPGWLTWTVAGLVLLVLIALPVAAWMTSNRKATPTALLILTKSADAKLLDFSNGFTPSRELTLNGSAVVENGSLRLTRSDPDQAGSAFTSTMQRIDRFETRFRFRLQNAQADGFTFTIQAVGPTALGPSGGGLGYGPHLAADSGGIPRSLAIKFDLFDNEGEGNSSTGLYRQGTAPTVAQSIDLLPRGIDLRSGHDFSAALNYDGRLLKVTITDEQTHAAATQSYAVNIPQVVGGPQAYVGFTGATGGVTALQRILTWTFQSK